MALRSTYNVDVSIMAKERRAIHCLVNDKIKEKICVISAIYALAQEKDSFWRHLWDLHDNSSLHWCLMGDLMKCCTLLKR